MKLLLDTHILLWAAGEPEKLSESARTLLTTPDNTLYFSVASLQSSLRVRGSGFAYCKNENTGINQSGGYQERWFEVSVVLPGGG